MRAIRNACALIAMVVATSAQSQAPAAPENPWFAIIEGNTTFLTGDTWTSNGVTYRLYGVQACLRGTHFTNQHGQKRDCGEAGLAMLIAMIRDLKPLCHAAIQSADKATQFLICLADINEGLNAGARIDLGTALITRGFAFAAIRPDGVAVHSPYAVAQQFARAKKSGLWQFPDLPDPNVAISRALTPQAVQPARPPSPSTSLR